LIFGLVFVVKLLKKYVDTTTTLSDDGGADHVAGLPPHALWPFVFSKHRDARHEGGLQQLRADVQDKNTHGTKQKTNTKLQPFMVFY
jgi:hypothetical protein